jgi:ribosome-binding protein aMBF1 (putative translation factor)
MGEVIPFRLRPSGATEPAPELPAPERVRATRPPGRGQTHPRSPAPPPVPDPPEELWRTLVGRRLRAERLRRGETQSVVAARAGISVQYLSELERGRKEPSSEVLAAATAALGLTLLDLTVAVARELHARRIADSRPTGPVALAA